MNLVPRSLLDIDATIESTASRLLPDPVVGACLGFIVGYLAANSTRWLGMDNPRLVPLSVGVFAAIGGWMGGMLRQGPSGRGKIVAWWCFTMTIIVGFASFVIGFIGSMLFIPGTASPLLAYFIIGPLGAVLGTASGVVIGLVVPPKL